jgi:hypothetical protein
MPVKIDAEFRLWPKLFAHRFQKFDDVTNIASLQIAQVAVMSGFGILWIEGARNTVALKFERSPAPAFRARALRQLAPG